MKFEELSKKKTSEVEAELLKQWKETDILSKTIEFQNNPQYTSEKYYKQYIRINSKIKTIDKEENKLILEYTDPDGKYTLQINCPMAGNLEALNEYKEQQEIKVKGTVYKFALKTEEQPNTVYLNDCFTE